ncbi:hypothetical protein [Actinomadura violacea]|uniref:Uncharacterized protein n=1 Tax=Actinomadura violacea TaxID=2819934 RepID=A0ABS3RZ80_9ACTN|nr:hypothetical protein [Actinomadura violacea]MBO2461603.1 hypothetical protein [Actinomadura violacea]
MAHRTRPTELPRDSRLMRRRLRAADAAERGSRSQRRRTAAENSMLLAR